MTWLAERSLHIVRRRDMWIFTVFVRLNGYLGKRGEETFSVVVRRRHGVTATVLLADGPLNYRNCHPAEFVWRRNGLQATASDTAFVTPGMVMVGAFSVRLRSHLGHGFRVSDVIMW